MKITRRSTHPLSELIDMPADLEWCVSKSAKMNRLSWRTAFDWLTSPAFRLHEYRNIHTQMLQGALCTVDCGHAQQNRDGSDNE